MTPDEVEAIVENIVIRWLEKQTGIPDRIDTSLSFDQAPPNGYLLTQGAYQTMCNTCTQRINSAFHSNISLSGPWRTTHYGQPIAVFIADGARLIPNELNRTSSFIAKRQRLVLKSRRTGSR
jgi:hypothetical protein